MSTGCSKKLQQSQSTQRHYVTMAKKHYSSACLCLYPSNSSVQQPDSQVNNCSMCPPPSESHTFSMVWKHLLRNNVMQHLTRPESGAVRLFASEDVKLKISLSDSSHRTAAFSCQLFNISGTFAEPRVVFLTAYQFSYTFDILFRSDSPRPIATNLPRDRVRCVNLAQKISNRTDSPLLFRKLFTNTVCTPSSFLTEGV